LSSKSIDTIFIIKHFVPAAFFLRIFMKNRSGALFILLLGFVLTTRGQPPAFTNLIVNGGFEMPVYSASSSGSNYEYNPTGAAWTFTPANTGGSGISALPSPWSYAFAAPEGLQVAFLQNAPSSISQVVKIPVTGDYTLSFYDAGREIFGGDVTYTVSFDGAPIGTYKTISGQTFSPHSIKFHAEPGSRTVQFTVKSTGQAHGYIDDSVFIDDIKLVQNVDSALLVNVDFTAHLNPAFSVKTGMAANGHSSNDFWNVYSRDIGSAFEWRSSGTVSNLLTAEKLPSGIDLSVENAQGAWASGSIDPMMQSYLYPSGGGDISVQLLHVPSGVYDLYVYAHGLNDTQNSVVELQVGDTPAVQTATSSGPSWNTGIWEEGRQFVVFHGISLSTSMPLHLTIKGGLAHEADLNGLQLIKSSTASPDLDPPDITITSPTNGSSGATVNLTGTITDAHRIVSANWFFEGGALEQLIISNAQFAVFNIPVGFGTNLLNISARDEAGNAALSTIRLVRESNTSTNVFNPAAMLLNVDFTAHLNPAFGRKAGPAAAGHDSNDFWNVYSRDVSSMFDWRSSGAVTNLLSSEHLSTGINLIVDNAGGAWPSGSADPMMNSYLYPGNGNITITLQKVPTGVYDLYVYAHGQLDSENAIIDFTLGGSVVAERSTSSAAGWDSGGWRQGQQFIVFHSIQIPVDGKVALTVKGGISGLPVINGLQLIAPPSANFDREAPVIAIFSPAAGTNDSVVHLTGTVMDNVGVSSSTWSLNEGVTRPLALGPNGQFSVTNVVLNVGTNRLRISASDLEGNVSTASVAVFNARGIPPSTNIVDTSNLLVNVDFTAHLNPAFSVKVGLAAVGHASNDFWNVYSRDAGSEYDWRDGGVVTNLVTAERGYSGMDLFLENAPGAWFTESDDAMLQSYLYPFGGNISVELSNVPPGHYDLYVYAHGLTADQNAVIDLRRGGSPTRERFTSADADWNPSHWQNGKQFVVFHSISVETNSAIGLTIKGGVSGLAVINGLQLVAATNTNVDFNPPVVTISSPLAGFATNRTIALTGYVTDDVDIANGRWELNGGAWNPLDITNGNFIVPTVTLNSGTNAIHVIASDSEGNLGSNSVQVIYRPSISLSIGSETTQEGSEVVVPIKFNAPGNIGGITFTVDYDPSLLFDPAISWRPTLGNALTSVNGDISGHVRAAIALPGIGFPSGETLLGRLTMRAGSIPTNRVTELKLLITGIFDTKGNEITSDFGAESGIIEITQRHIPGDNNGNNRLDIGDATLMMQFVTALVAVQPWDFLANDLNHNGQLDLGDVIQVLRVVVGLDPQPKGPKTRLSSTVVGDDSASSVLKLTASNSSIAAADVLRVQVSIEGNTEPFAGVSFELHYPTNALRLIDGQSLRPGPIVPASAAVLWNVSPFENDFANQDGNLTGAFSTGIPWPANHGTIAEISFQIQAGVSSEVTWPVTLTNGELSDGSHVQSLSGDEIELVTRVPASLAFVEADKSSIRLHVSGQPGAACRVEYSDDLVAWVALSSGIVTLSETGATISDSLNGGANYRFYRVVEVPQ
jgi:hypothetical protein